MKWLYAVNHWPLRLKIVLLLFVCSVLPLAIMGAIEFRHARDEVLRTTGELLAARGDEITSELDDFNDQYQDVARRIAMLPDVVRYARTPADSRETSSLAVLDTLNIWPKSDGAIRGVAILDAKGTVLLATEQPMKGRDLANYGYIQQAIKGMATTSDLHIYDVGDGPIASIGYLAPIHDEQGQIVALSAVWVRASAFWQVVRAGNEKAGLKSFSVIFDHHGIRIAHSYNEDIVFHPGGRLDTAAVETMVAERRFGDRTRQLLDEPKEFPEQFDRARSSSPSEELFRGYAPVNQQWNFGVPRRLRTVPWTLFYMIPEHNLDAPIATLLKRIILLSIAAIVFAVTAGIVISRGIVGSVKLVSETAESLGSSARELTTSVAQIASSTAESATAVSQTTATVEEVKQTAQISTQKAKSVSDSAQRAMHIAQAGRKSVDASIEGMKHIHSQMTSIAEGVMRLTERSQAIGEIIATVKDLTEQSNLLAVNAAIEAAKAGDQGRGFAVVAQEVKNLADQSKHATSQVRSILNEVQQATATAAMATELGTKAVEAGVKQSTDAGDAIRSLADSITEAAQAATQIAASSQQQLAGMDQVSTAMDSIKRASEQNATSAKQLEVSAHSLRESGQGLMTLVDKYKV